MAQPTKRAIRALATMTITNEGVKDHSQESINASIADKNARAMTNLMWQDHPSPLTQLPTWSMPAQKSAKTVFFEENDKSSSPKWGDQDDEEFPIAPLWNYGALNEENASSSAATPAEKSNNGTPSGKDEIDPNTAESPVQKEADRSGATPETSERFKVFLKDKLQERQHCER